MIFVKHTDFTSEWWKEVLPTKQGYVLPTSCLAVISYRLPHINSAPFAILVCGWTISPMVMRAPVYRSPDIALTPAICVNQFSLQISYRYRSAGRGSEDVMSCNYEPRALPGYRIFVLQLYCSGIGMCTCVSIEVSVSPVAKSCRHPAAIAPRSVQQRL